MQRILSSFRKAVQRYNLIQDGDVILVGLSGGKDSLILLRALVDFQKFNLYKYKVIAGTIDMYSGKEDYSKLKEYCKSLGVQYEIEKTDINDIVFNLRKEKNPCSLCAKMRRGALNSLANRLGCNKIALGHHLQDVIETFFLSLLYEGRLSTMKPKSYMSKSNITLIRPLFLTHENLIKSVAKDFPVMKSKCPADKDSKRQEVEKIINQLDKLIPDAKKRIENAILSTESYSLLDKD